MWLACGAWFHPEAGLHTLAWWLTTSTSETRMCRAHSPCLACRPLLPGCSNPPQLPPRAWFAMSWALHAILAMPRLPEAHTEVIALSAQLAPILRADSFYPLTLPPAPTRLLGPSSGLSARIGPYFTGTSVKRASFVRCCSYGSRWSR